MNIVEDYGASRLNLILIWQVRSVKIVRIKADIAAFCTLAPTIRAVNIVDVRRACLRRNTVLQRQMVRPILS